MAERIKCPKCGSHRVKQIEDKSRVLSYVAHRPIYAKIYLCGDCGHKFDLEELKHS